MVCGPGRHVVLGIWLSSALFLLCLTSANDHGFLGMAPKDNTIWLAQAISRVHPSHPRAMPHTLPKLRAHDTPTLATVRPVRTMEHQARTNAVLIRGGLQDGPAIANIHMQLWTVAKVLFVPLVAHIAMTFAILRQRHALSTMAMSSTFGMLQKNSQPSRTQRFFSMVSQMAYRSSLVAMGVVAGMSLVGPAAAMVGTTSATVTVSSASVLPRVALWASLFTVAAAFHSAEVAITTLWPWKVKEFAEDEGSDSLFHYLAQDITRVLTTIIVASTICTVYGTAIISTVIADVCVTSKGIAIATAGLTAFTLFFQELVPKALGVSNAELVARAMVPTIAALSYVLNPIGMVFGWSSKALLQLLGFKYQDSGVVTGKELRFLLEGARVSGSVEKEEAKMITGVLDLHGTKVCEVMTPRVDMVAIERTKTLRDLMELVHQSKFSRIPVYGVNLDTIVGVVLARSIFAYALAPSVGDATEFGVHNNPAFQNQAFRDLSAVLVEQEMEPTYFVPEGMTVPNVLEEMRKRRLHLALVVDEYGGTSGVVTLEDLLEEIVGEIYDEDDTEERQNDNALIQILPQDPVEVNERKVRYAIRGEAELKNVIEALQLELGPGNDDFVTISGLLCARAGYIPQVGDLVTVPPYVFDIKDADERRIISVIAVAPANVIANDFGTF